MKKILILILLLVISLNIVGCGNKNIDEQNKEIKNIEVLIYNEAEELIYNKKIEAEEKTLLEILKSIDELKIETEDSEYGAFIISIKGIKQENDYFWNYYINGDYASIGVSSYKVKDNDKLEFRLEKFE